MVDNLIELLQYEKGKYLTELIQCETSNTFTGLLQYIKIVSDRTIAV